MGIFDWKHWIVILVVVVLVFGTKKLKNLGTDVGESIKGFRKAMNDDEKPADPAANPAPPVQPVHHHCAAAADHRQSGQVIRGNAYDRPCTHHPAQPGSWLERLCGPPPTSRTHRPDHPTVGPVDPTRRPTFQPGHRPCESATEQVVNLRPATGRGQPLGRQDAGVCAGRPARHLLPPAHLLPLEQRLEPLHQPGRAVGRDRRAGRAAGVEQALRAVTKGDLWVAFFVDS
nr:twin-arginine translocase TatA/TatE family subunit [Pseudomonas emilianonis]